MKLSCPLALRVLFAISFILAACGLESQPATPTIEHTITETPQPSLTPAPTEIPLPEGAEELIDRLGEKASAFNYAEESFELIYDGISIGTLSVDKFVYCPGEEIIKVSFDNLEILDGHLVSINRQKTKEMGVDWVDYAWINGKILPVNSSTIKPISFASEVITINNIDRLQVLQIEGLGFKPTEGLNMFVSPIDSDLVITTKTKISFLDPDTLEEKRRIEIPTFYQKAYPDHTLAGLEPDTFAISEDREKLATLLGGLVSIWNINTEELIMDFIFSADYEMIDLSLSANGERIAINTITYLDNKYNRNVYVYDLNNGNMIRHFEEYRFASFFQNPFLSNGSQIILCKGSMVELFDIAIDPPILSLDPPNDSGKWRLVTYSPDEKFIAISTSSYGSTTSRIHVYNVNNGDHVFTDSVNGGCGIIVFSGDGAYFAYPSRDPFIHVWRVSDWSLVNTLYSPSQFGFRQLVFSQNGQKLATFASETYPYKLYVWDIISGEILRSEQIASWSPQIIFSANNEYLFTSPGWYNEITRVSIHDKTTIIRADSGGTSFSFFAEGNLLATGNKGGTVNIWNLSNGNRISRLGSPDYKKIKPYSIINFVKNTIFSPDGRWLAAQMYNGSLLLYNLEKNVLAYRLLDGLDYSARKHWMGFSEDGTRFAAFDGKYNVYLWDVASGQVIVKMPMPVLNIGSRHDNLFFEDSDNTLYTYFVTWDISNCELEDNNTEPREHCGTMTRKDRGCHPSNPYCQINTHILYSRDCDVATLAVSPNKEIAVVGCSHSYPQVFNLVGNKYIMDIPIEFHTSSPMIFSPDGKFLILDNFIILGIK